MEQRTRLKLETKCPSGHDKTEGVTVRVANRTGSLLSYQKKKTLRGDQQTNGRPLYYETLVALNGTLGRARLNECKLVELLGNKSISVANLAAGDKHVLKTTICKGGDSEG